MPKFMNAMKDSMIKWLKEEKVLMDDLAAIMRAFKLANDVSVKDFDNILASIETFALKHFLHMTPNQAAQIMICNG